jgi:hypothetical protein
MTLFLWGSPHHESETTETTEIVKRPDGHLVEALSWQSSSEVIEVQWRTLLGSFVRCFVHSWKRPEMNASSAAV